MAASCKYANSSTCYESITKLLINKRKYNISIKPSLFPSCLKAMDITPIYKKGEKNLKNNHRPVNILPVLSKLYERSMFRQISEFFENIFFKKPF